MGGAACGCGQLNQFDGLKFRRFLVRLPPL
jgi:hypothetical protein